VNQVPSNFSWFLLILLLTSLFICTFLLSWILQKYASKLKSDRWKLLGFILGL